MNLLFFIFNIILLIIYTNEEEVKTAVKITATSGIIKKEKNSKTKILSFIIPCQVDKNITNKISIVDITFNTKKPEDTSKIFPSICNLHSVRLESDENYANSYLSCQLNYTNYKDENIDEDMNLIIDGNPSYTSDIVVFTFENFDKIGQAIEISDLYIFNSNSDICSNNNYHFKMNFTSMSINPLESTACNIGINNDIHDTARCAIPLGNYDIICSIDVSEEKIEKGEKIEIKSQELVKCENGQNLKIVNDAQNILEINEECDKSIFIAFNIFYLFVLFLMLF